MRRSRIGSSICSRRTFCTHEPRTSSLPDHELGPEHEGRPQTAEEVVDHALAYKPIELGPATE
jgi:hypothetical protein